MSGLSKLEALYRCPQRHVLSLTLGWRVTVVVLCVIHSLIHSVIWNCVHFYATTKARTRSPREKIAPKVLMPRENRPVACKHRGI